MNIFELRQLAGGEEIDYLFLTSALKSYAKPRHKISQWLKSGDLIRVKKGLYIFGPAVAQRLYSKEHLANMIYGPSAISLIYALSYYGIIPERVETVTSITNNRNKHFQTPCGSFSYHYLCSEKYSVGIQLLPYDSQANFLIAAPEKALSDLIYTERKILNIQTIEDMRFYLLNDMRMNESLLDTLSLPLLVNISQCFRHPCIDILLEFLKERRN